MGHGLLVAAIGLCGGCHEDDLLPGGLTPPPVAWEGSHVSLATHRDLDSWCPGTLPRLDEFARAMEDTLGPPPDSLIEYFLLEHPLPPEACPSPFGCTYRGDGRVFIISSLLPADHELVHAAKPGRLPSFFEEGIAVHLGGNVAEDVDFSRLDIRRVIDTRWDQPLDGDREYALAAHFTSYLVHRFGLTTYGALHRTTIDSRTEFEARFEAALGVPLAEAIDDYEATYDPTHFCRVRSLHHALIECGREPELVVGPSPVTLDFDVSCDDAATVGPLQQRSAVGDVAPRLWQSLTLELDRPVNAWGETNNSFTVQQDPDGSTSSVRVEVVRCDSDCFEVEDNRASFAPPRFDIALRPGRYVLWASREVDDPGPVRLEWR